MLEAWRIALNYSGPSQAKIGEAAGVKAKAVARWSKGQTKCPVAKRESVDRAMGRPVDWFEYDRQCDALAEPKEPAPVTAAPAPTATPAQTPATNQDDDEIAAYFGGGF